MRSMQKIMTKQHQFFSKEKTKVYAFRLRALLRLRASIQVHEDEITDALKQDLGKAAMEGYMTEIGMVLEELSHAIHNLKDWMAPVRVTPPAACFPSRAWIQKEPYGVVLIMSPWNYPFLLTMSPLIGAIAAGNCCVVKPSAYSPTVSSILEKILAHIFPESYVAVIQGGRAENQALLEQRFDYIFFTGSGPVGRLVMEKAARHLTPVTLELGGKSPCIVDETANLRLAARRLVFGKFLNSGQTCVAPDYVLVQDTIKEDFIRHLLYWIRRMYQKEPLLNENYPRMVSEKHFDRILALIRNETVLTGGYGNPGTLKIAPTILDGITVGSPVMQDEIFGPVLPILTYHELREAEHIIQSLEKPLALYLFSRDKRVWKRILKKLSFGGGCINDTIMHLSSPRLPFGGVGASGMGSYHGYYSFGTFSHDKSIVNAGSRIDIPLRYQPYSKRKTWLIHRIIH